MTGRGENGAHTPPGHANGMQQPPTHNPFPRDAESQRQPRLYMDLRPYIDCGPITVRFAACASCHVRLRLGTSQHPAPFLPLQTGASLASLHADARASPRQQGPSARPHTCAVMAGQW